MEHVEAVVQILAEAAVLHRTLQIDVGGGDDPHIDPQALGGADADDGLFLQEAQQAGLQVERQVADLVEEQNALVGGLDVADLALAGASERALLVAEQFGVDQVRRDRAAVHRHEGTARARRVLVDGARDQFLAGARFAADQDRRIDGDDLLDLPIELDHLRAEPGHAEAAALTFDAALPVADHRPPVGMPQGHQQALAIERQRMEIMETAQDQRRPHRIAQQAAVEERDPVQFVARQQLLDAASGPGLAAVEDHQPDHRRRRGGTQYAVRGIDRGHDLEVPLRQRERLERRRNPSPAVQHDPFSTKHKALFLLPSSHPRKACAGRSARGLPLERNPARHLYFFVAAPGTWRVDGKRLEPSRPGMLHFFSKLIAKPITLVLMRTSLDSLFIVLESPARNVGKSPEKASARHSRTVTGRSAVAPARFRRGARSARIGALHALAADAMPGRPQLRTHPCHPAAPPSPTAC